MKSESGKTETLTAVGSSALFGDLIGETNTIIINHPPQERRQLAEFLVWQTEGHVKLQCSIELYRDAASAQSHGNNLGPSIVIMSVVPLDFSRTRKLEIATDVNVWSAALVLVLTCWGCVEGHLKNLAANRVSATHKLCFEAESHIFTERHE